MTPLGDVQEQRGRNHSRREHRSAVTVDDSTTAELRPDRRGLYLLRRLGQGT
ncbi:hypothetical protein ACIOKD_38270 [Streptomyces sp. NPDC087844]|uniref:hypothetical protein n=1 Tax=Streptomyces sp. NPDC087844 TaxID=3365805 RepID=UPI0037F9194C